MAKVLGLDLGPNSVGWALIDDSQEGGALIDLGARVFAEGVDAFDTAKEASRNEGRRVARGMRKQIARRARRRSRLRSALVSVGLWPDDAATAAGLLNQDPYPLRARALVERLEPFEIGRVLLHLNQRRGFLSNKKKDRGDKEVQGLLKEIQENEETQRKGGFETIGAMLADKAANLDHRNRQDGDHVRNRHLSRRQIEQEFDAVWESQRQHHPKLLTDALKYGALGRSTLPEKPTPAGSPIGKSDPRRGGESDLESFGLHGLMFFQRTMYWPKSAVGLCELEPKQKRCPRSDRMAERFRLLQEVNNLRYVEPDSRDERPLNDRQRQALLDFLATRDRAEFTQIRKIKGIGFPETVTFNLERGKRPSMKGMVVDAILAKATGKGWHDRPDAEKTAIVRVLLDHQGDEEGLVASLVERFGMSAEEADAAAGVDLPPGYANLSLKALEKLLPHLERGLIYQSASDPEQSALHAAGYLRRDELHRRLFDCLPIPGRKSSAQSKLGDLPNPVVKRALVELRKVVNAVIREYGKPDAVHVEMARTVQVGAEKRKEMSARMRERESLRNYAAGAIKKAGHAVRRESIVRYLAWEEQGHDCVYCSQPISQHQLFNDGETDLDHILPYSRTLDDSQMNKVICHRACNRDKGQRTPYEWLAATDPEKYERVCQHANSLLRRGLFPYAKYKRFLQKELELDKFIARQLNDTGYIARATVEYLQLLFDKPGAVLGLKGQLTSELRWQWGLDTLLSEMPDSPAWEANGDLSRGEKNRADHRHHAIDAVVVALTNRSRLQKLTKIYREGGARQHGEVLPLPWSSLREDVRDRIAKVRVSHRVERKVRGALHEETQYGPTEKPNEWVVRKPVEALSPNEVERIRDPAIRQIVLDALANAGLESGRGKKPDAKKMKAALSNLKMKSGVPIKKVRITKPELTIRPLRDAGSATQAYVKPGSTHHLCIFEWEEKGKRKREAVFVSMLEAKRRLKHGEPVIRRDHLERPDARFVMSLSSRELVLAKWKGETKLLQFKTAASTQGQLYFVEPTDARRSADQRQFVFTANTLDARKATVDPLGRIRWAND